MVVLKIAKLHRLYSLLRHQSTSVSILASQSILFETNEYAFKSLFPYSSFQRTFSASAQMVFTESVEERTKSSSMGSENVDSTRKSRNGRKGKKPLDVMFKEAVGISETHECSESSDEEFEEEGEKLTEIEELKRKLRKLERDVKRLKGNLKEGENEQTPKKVEVQNSQSKSKSLYSFFAVEPENLRSMFVKNSDSEEKSYSSKQEKADSSAEMKPFKGFSPQMASLVSLLHQQGYFKNANFLPPKHLNLSCFSSYYSVSFVRSAAEKFGEDHQEIAKYLSRDHLTRIALFGCPSTERRTAFAAKRLRSFYDIKEDIVCRPCKLRSSCKVANHTVGRKIHDLHLKDVMKTLTWYALDMVPPQLEIPDEIKSSIDKLLNEVIDLSKEQPLNPTFDNLDLSIQVN